MGRKSNVVLFLERISQLDWLNAYHYKIIIRLLDHEYTQAEIARNYKLQTTNINKYCRQLEQVNIVLTSKVVGRNKYLKLNLKWGESESNSSTNQE